MNGRIETEMSKSKDNNEKKEEILTAEVKTALEMLQQMEISKKECEDREEYKNLLLKSELLSKSSFSDMNISEELIDLLHSFEFKNPSIIQSKAVPEILLGNNVAFQSNSGSGKTIAFIIGAIMKVDIEKKEPQVIIISPTRDLAGQIYEVLEKFKKKIGFTSRLALKDMVDRYTDINEQILVGPPGTIKFITQRKIDCKKISMVILDEADALLDDSMGLQTVSIIQKIPNRQLVLFSATFSDKMKENINKMCKSEIKTFYLEEKNSKPGNISQFYMEINENKKAAVLKELFGLIPVGQSIIFVHTRDKAEKIQKELMEDGFDSSVLHGQLTDEQRDSVIAKYKSGEIKALVTTNVLSRGLDVPQLNVAVNYDIPRTMNREPDIETYIHRIGRTGRFNRTGVSITFVSGEKDLSDLMFIQKKIKDQIKYITIDSMHLAIKQFINDKEYDA